jgi:hypothetical protein
MEAMNQQERGNAIAELDRMQKLQEKEEKHALLSVQRKDFEDNNKVNLTSSSSIIERSL